jgi:dTDP-4-amino-4,6-dideoxygalactose transaminase
MVDLRGALDATSAQWQANLRHMFAAGQFITGEQLAKFEQELASAFGAKFAVGVGSGTSAIELCLRAAALAENRNEVITSTLTSPFTALAILAAGCKPKFADIYEDSLLLRPDDVEERVTRKTGALLPVHLYGAPCDLPRLCEIGRKRQLSMVQDACQAHGATYDGHGLTSYSPGVAYSFYPTKNLGGLGDGGAVLTDSPKLARNLRLLRDGGRKADQVSRVPAVNSRLDEMQCCYLRAFLPRLSEWNDRRARLARVYDEELATAGPVRLVRREPRTVNHLYVIRVPRRQRLRDFLQKHGVATGIHYAIPLHMQPAFSECGLKRGDLPVAERASREILSLPLFPYMADTAARRVAQYIREFYS